MKFKFLESHREKKVKQSYKKIKIKTIEKYII